MNTKRAGIYSPGYYRIEKYGAIAACGDYNEMRILKGHYLENKKLLDVGQEIGISESRVYALHKIAVRKVEIFLKCNRK